MNIKDYLEQKRIAVDRFLDEVTPPAVTPPTTLHESMRYSLMAGGKRVRPILTIAAAEALGQTPPGLMAVTCSLELIHTYSLIHDDLPSMYNDDFRRGKPTNHKVYGEAMAILAGDALLTMAFDLISRPDLMKGFEPVRQVRIIQELAFGSGNVGMVGGQVELEFVAESAAILDQQQLLQLVRVLTQRRAANHGQMNGPHQRQHPGNCPGCPVGGMGPGAGAGMQGGPRRGGPGGGPGGRGECPGQPDCGGAGPFASLGLSTEQQQAVHEAMQTMHTAMRAAHDQFESGALTEEALRQAVDAARQAFDTALQGILTPEQYATLQRQHLDRLVEHLERRIEHLRAGAARHLQLLTRTCVRRNS